MVMDLKRRMSHSAKGEEPVRLRRNRYLAVLLFLPDDLECRQCPSILLALPDLFIDYYRYLTMMSDFNRELSAQSYSVVDQFFQTSLTAGHLPSPESYT